jgi:uracil-DNA glycosylase
MAVKIEDSWAAALAGEFEKPYFVDLTDFVRREYAGVRVYPPAGSIFRALDSCPFDDVRVVIIGQDPYHGPGQANGMCFSVGEGVEWPPSLRNILQEVADDTGVRARSGDLERWARQGVLLLNSVLTVRAHDAASHAGMGWERFTDAVVRALSERRRGLVYMLWGSYAQRKASFVDAGENLILKAPHPSPLSAYRGFMGCGHFSIANAYLLSQGGTPIEW